MRSLSQISNFVPILRWLYTPWGIPAPLILRPDAGVDSPTSARANGCDDVVLPWFPRIAPTVTGHRNKAGACCGATRSAGLSNAESLGSGTSADWLCAMIARSTSTRSSLKSPASRSSHGRFWNGLYCHRGPGRLFGSTPAQSWKGMIPKIIRDQVQGVRRGAGFQPAVRQVRSPCSVGVHRTPPIGDGRGIRADGGAALPAPPNRTRVPVGRATRCGPPRILSTTTRTLSNGLANCRRWWRV